MRYFLITSIILHAALFVVWPTHYLPGRAGGPVTISLLINNDIVPQETLHKKQSAKHNVKNIQTDNRPDTGITSTGIDTATSTNRPTINQPQKIGATDATASDLKDSRDDTPQTAQTSVQPVSGAQIQAHLRRAFIPYFTYPRLAREKGWQGTVELAVKIDTQGLLTKARIIHSSGFGVLDHAALKSIRQIKVLPNTLQWLNNHGLEVNFPVKYQLIDI